ncbi:MAG: ribosome alternative rescue factor ArfA [Pseudomonadales bacterium]|nr:ribosome alternative rescue factor ArfA [Pseudomonadales bacterium]
MGKPRNKKPNRAKSIISQPLFRCRQEQPVKGKGSYRREASHWEASSFLHPQKAAEGLLPFHSWPRRSLFWREARREERDLVVPNKRRVTPPRTKTGPALRVAREMAPAVVAGLGKGMPLPASCA